MADRLLTDKEIFDIRCSFEHQGANFSWRDEDICKAQRELTRKETLIELGEQLQSLNCAIPAIRRMVKELLKGNMPEEMKNELRRDYEDD